MSGRIKFLCTYFLAWVGLFLVARLVFILYYLGRARRLSFKTNLLSFVYGLRMDLSMSAYLLVPVCILMLAGVFLSFFPQPLVYLLYTYLFVFLFVLVVVADLQVYGSWGFRLDATPLRYLSTPKEAWASISHLPWLFILFFLLAATLALCYLF